MAFTVGLISLFSGRRVPSTIAMTGEISLRGKVTAVGMCSVTRHPELQLAVAIALTEFIQTDPSRRRHQREVDRCAYRRRQDGVATGAKQEGSARAAGGSQEWAADYLCEVCDTARVLLTPCRGCELTIRQEYLGGIEERVAGVDCRR